MKYPGSLPVVERGAGVEYMLQTGLSLTPFGLILIWRACPALGGKPEEGLGKEKRIIRFAHDPPGVILHNFGNKFTMFLSLSRGVIYFNAECLL